MKLRIIIADDNPKTLSTSQELLASDFDIVATTSDGALTLAEIRRLVPSVAVLDLNMPHLSGIEIAREIRRLGLASKVVICSLDFDPELVIAAQAAGVLGYVYKPRHGQDLVTAVHHAAIGRVFVSPHKIGA